MTSSSYTDSKNNNIYPKVLVVGMSRTGTDSMKRALELLYGGPAYHMSVVLNKPKHLKFWSALAFGQIKPNEADWPEIFRGFVATTDLPTAYYFEEIAQKFPQAKVILTLREEEEWADSYSRLIKAIKSFELIRFLPPLNRFWPFGQQLNKLIFEKAIVDENGINRQVIIDAYRRHNNKVRKIIPADNLLEFNVKQGWKPLCSFLELEEPDFPFPHRNAGAEGPTKILANATTRLSAFLGILILGLILITGLFVTRLL